ncbi:MAG: 16S rRNA processing protein RimM [Rickettsiales bacterium]|jgi:16S rRNA processing protein RimM
MQILVAKITSPHGIRGEVKLVSYLEDSYDLEKYNSIFTKDSKNYKLRLIRNIKQNIYIAKINNINTRNQAEEIRNLDLFINKEELKNLSDDQFYYHDLTGLKVRDVSDKEIGTVVNVMNFGAGDLFEVSFTDDNYSKQLNIFPFNSDIVREVNLEGGYVTINKMDLL